MQTHKQPRSQAQLEASRRNGANSKGPVTAEGKRNSSQSAIRHGLTSSTHTCLATEDPDQYKEVCEAFIEDLRPATKTELRLVEKLANLDWRLERLVMMETALLNMAGGIHAEAVIKEFDSIDGIGFIVEAWRRSLNDPGHAHELLRRYMATFQNQFNNTLANFQKLEARRRERNLEPESEIPYHRPEFETMESDLEPNPLPEPAPSPKQPHPPIDIQTRCPQTPTTNEPKNPSPDFDPSAA